MQKTPVGGELFVLPKTPNVTDSQGTWKGNHSFFFFPEHSTEHSFFRIKKDTWVIYFFVTEKAVLYVHNDPSVV